MEKYSIDVFRKGFLSVGYLPLTPWIIASWTWNARLQVSIIKNPKWVLLSPFPRLRKIYNWNLIWIEWKDLGLKTWRGRRLQGVAKGARKSVNTKLLTFRFYSKSCFSTYSGCQKRAVWGTQLLACGELPFSPRLSRSRVDDATADLFTANTLSPATFVLSTSGNTYIELTSLSNTN